MKLSLTLLVSLSAAASGAAAVVDQHADQQAAESASAETPDEGAVDWIVPGTRRQTRSTAHRRTTKVDVVGHGVRRNRRAALYKSGVALGEHAEGAAAVDWGRENAAKGARDHTIRRLETQCSCSPHAFTFQLDLSASCPPLPPPFPPNAVFGAGVKDYTCTIGPESTSSVTDMVPVSISDVVPVSIYSIQFLEVDSGFNVINQDSTYVRGIEFLSGNTFSYDSIAGTDGAVPGGMNMVLRGVNAAGETIRNVFTIFYTNDCGVPTFSEGESIGWVIFESFEPAAKETCETPSPTSSPTQNPTESPTPSWCPGNRGVDFCLTYDECVQCTTTDDLDNEIPGCVYHHAVGKEGCALQCIGCGGTCGLANAKDKNKNPGKPEPIAGCGTDCKNAGSYAEICPST